MRQRIARAASAEGISTPTTPPAMAAGSAEADTWAAGALLWLLVTSPTGTGEEETRQFRAEVPDAVRALVRRCVFPAQAEPLTTMDALALALEALAEHLRQARPMSAPLTPPALRAARDAMADMADMAEWPEDAPVMAISGRPWAQTPVASASVFEAPTDPQLAEMATGPGADLAATQPASVYGDAPYRDSPIVPRFSLPSRPLGEPPGPIVPSVPRWELPARGDALAPESERAHGGIGLTTVLIVGLILFIVCFVVGFMTPSLFAH
jgi:hypothetical protein